jgi:hypothetical protein
LNCSHGFERNLIQPKAIVSAGSLCVEKFDSICVRQGVGRVLDVNTFRGTYFLQYG